MTHLISTLAPHCSAPAPSDTLVCSLMYCRISLDVYSAHGSAKKAAAQPKKARPRRSSSHNQGKAPLASDADGYAMGSYDNEPIDETSDAPSWIELRGIPDPRNRGGISLTSSPQSPNVPQDMVAPIPFHLHSLSGVPSSMPGSPFAPSLHGSTGVLPGMPHMTPTLPHGPIMPHSENGYGMNHHPSMNPYGQMPPAASAPPSLAPVQQHSDAIARILALQQANAMPSNSNESLNGSGLSSSTGSMNGTAHHMNGNAHNTNFGHHHPMGGLHQPFPSFDMPRTMSPSMSAPPTSHNMSTPPIPFPQYGVSAFPSAPSSVAPFQPQFPFHMPPPQQTLQQQPQPQARSNLVSLDHLMLLQQPKQQTPPIQSPPAVFQASPTYQDASAAANRHSTLKSSNKGIPSPRNNIHAHHNFGVPAQP